MHIHRTLYSGINRKNIILPAAFLSQINGNCLHRTKICGRGACPYSAVSKIMMLINAQILRCRVVNYRCNTKAAGKASVNSNKCSVPVGNCSFFFSCRHHIIFQRIEQDQIFCCTLCLSSEAEFIRIISIRIGYCAVNIGIILRCPHLFIQSKGCGSQSSDLMACLRIKETFRLAVRIQTGHQIKFIHSITCRIDRLAYLSVSNILISGLISHTVEDTRSKIFNGIPAMICAVVELILVGRHIDVNNKHSSTGIFIVIHHLQRIRSLKQFFPIRIHFQGILLILCSFWQQIIKLTGRLRHQLSAVIYIHIIFICLCSPCNGVKSVDRIVLVAGHFF